MTAPGAEEVEVEVKVGTYYLFGLVLPHWLERTFVNNSEYLYPR